MRANKTYRLFGRCLPSAPGAVLVVAVLAQRTDGATSGSSAMDAPRPPVATLTVPCDGTESSRDLVGLPAGAGELAISLPTHQVSTGWAVLTAIH